MQLIDATPETVFPLRPPLPIPSGWNEQSIYSLLEAVHPADAPPGEMANYCRQDWRRFLYTWGLARDIHGECLELGANPYFTTTLLSEFTDLRLTLANYFGPQFSSLADQKVAYCDPISREPKFRTLQFHHFNLETERFPFAERSYDCVLLCEIIEHLQMDPIAVIREIKRVLKENGVLILSTPNVARLENVAKLIAGANLYDPYSGYGPYGRHNREYSRHELFLLLDYCGFDIEIMFTADVHENLSATYCSLGSLKDLLEFRQHDLGQYIFVKCRSTRPARQKRPEFLYRSYAEGELEPFPG